LSPSPCCFCLPAPRKESSWDNDCHLPPGPKYFLPNPTSPFNSLSNGILFLSKSESREFYWSPVDCPSPPLIPYYFLLPLVSSFVSALRREGSHPLLFFLFFRPLLVAAVFFRATYSSGRHFVSFHPVSPLLHGFPFTLSMSLLLFVRPHVFSFITRARRFVAIYPHPSGFACETFSAGSSLTISLCAYDGSGRLFWMRFSF